MRACTTDAGAFGRRLACLCAPNLESRPKRNSEEQKQNPNPSHTEEFGTPRVSIVLQADSGAARMNRPPAPAL